jgi:hypothetical protein
MTDLKGRELAEALCRKLEPDPILGECRFSELGHRTFSRREWWEADFGHSTIPTWEPAPVSSDIASAWRVVEEMKRHGWFLTIRIVPDKVFADFSKFPDRHLSSRPKTVGSTADDESTAICRAALAALRQGNAERS